MWRSVTHAPKHERQHRSVVEEDGNCTDDEADGWELVHKEEQRHGEEQNLEIGDEAHSYPAALGDVCRGVANLVAQIARVEERGSMDDDDHREVR